jgi:tetratricopeptide (TPR) repeat protein
MADEKTVLAFRRAFTRDEYLTVVRLGEQIIQDLRDQGWAWAMYGSALSAMGRAKEATAALRKGVRLTPPRFRRIALTELGAHYERIMKPAQARRQYELAIEAAPKNAAGYIYLGALELGLGRIEQAAAVLRRGAKCRDGPIEEVWYNLAAALAASGEYGPARKAVDRALKLDPKYKLAKKLKRQLED